MGQLTFKSGRWLFSLLGSQKYYIVCDGKSSEETHFTNQ